MTELVLILSLLAAVLYGASDFLGGLLSRRAPYQIVGLVSQATAATGAIAAALAVSSPSPDVPALAWGMGAGLCGAIGTLALYRGLAHGRMNVAGPLSAVSAAGFPVVLDLVVGQHLSISTVVGILLAVPGIWLASKQAGTRSTGGGTRDGLLGGLGFAGLFICLNQAGDAAGLWPVVASQVAAAMALAAVAFSTVALSSRGGVLSSVRGGARPVHRKSLRAAIWPGLLGVSGTTCYFLATQAGTLSMSAVIASLYPAVTVALATIVLRERTTLWHGCGLALCTISVVAFVSG